MFKQMKVWNCMLAQNNLIDEMWPEVSLTQPRIWNIQNTRSDQDQSNIPPVYASIKNTSSILVWNTIYMGYHTLTSASCGAACCVKVIVSSNGVGVCFGTWNSSSTVGVLAESTVSLTGSINSTTTWWRATTDLTLKPDKVLSNDRCSSALH